MSEAWMEPLLAGGARRVRFFEARHAKHGRLLVRSVLGRECTLLVLECACGKRSAEVVAPLFADQFVGAQALALLRAAVQSVAPSGATSERENANAKAEQVTQ
jgi:hypothetical protein